VHKYFNPYESPYESFINYMNILSDLEFRVKAANRKLNKSKPKAVTKSKPKTSKK